MKKMLLLLTLALALALAATASANPIGFAQIGDEQFTFELVKGQDGAYSAIGLSFQNSSGSLTFDITTNIDPYISYGLVATNFSPFPVVFALVIPAFSIGPYDSANVTASIAGGLTDVTGDGVRLEPVFVGGIQVNVTDLASWSVGDFFEVGPSEAGSSTYPADYFTGSFPGTHSLFGEIVAFSLTGNFDIAALTGYCSIAAVPQGRVPPAPLPSSLLLLGSGLLALAGRRRQK